MTPHQRQLAVSRRADRLATLASRVTRACWRDLLRAMRLPWHEAGVQVGMLLRALPLVLRQALGDELADVVRWGHASARRVLVRALGVKRLRRAAYERVGHARQIGANADHVQHPWPDAAAPVVESINWHDLLAPYREPDPTADLTPSDLLAILFPPPDPERVNQIVYASGWAARIAAGTGLAAPEAVAQRVASGMMLGHDQAAIMRELLPVVQGVQVTARRLARTEGLRVAAAVQRECHEGLGDLVVGYVVRATLDQNTRPEHRARDGTSYWAHPGPGQLGYDQMPHPPAEADGSTSWNCRCYLEPRLRD